MEKPINPKINKIMLRKLRWEINNGLQCLLECRKLVQNKLDEQAYYEEDMGIYKEAMAHEKMTHTVFRMRKSGSTFAEIGKKVGKDRREVSAIYRKQGMINVSVSKA